MRTSEILRVISRFCKGLEKHTDTKSFTSFLEHVAPSGCDDLTSWRRSLPRGSCSIRAMFSIDPSDYRTGKLVGEEINGWLGLLAGARREMKALCGRFTIHLTEANGKWHITRLAEHRGRVWGRLDAVTCFHKNIEIAVALSERREDRFRYLLERLRHMLDYYSRRAGRYGIHYHDLPSGLDRCWLFIVPGTEPGVSMEQIRFFDILRVNVDNAERYWREDIILQVVAHEVAHKFGLPVGVGDKCKLGNYWLSEGFARYLDISYGEHLARTAKNGYARWNWEAVAADYFRVLDRDIPLRSDLFHLAKVWEPTEEVAYGVLYCKGPYVFRMLADLLGPRKMFEIVKKMRKIKSEGLDCETFREVIEAETGRDLKWFFKQWLDRVGVPEFYLEYDVTQRHQWFEVHGNIVQKGELYRMQVRLLFRTGHATQTRELWVHSRNTPFHFQFRTYPKEVALDSDPSLLRWHLRANS